MIDEKAIGKKIRKCRKSNGMTLQDVANKSGLSVGYLSKIEKSMKGPPISTLGSLSKVFGVSVSYLLGEEVKENNICISRKGDRPVVSGSGTSFGYAYEALAADYVQRHIEPYILTLPINPENKVIFQHDSEELLMVIKGEMKFKHGDQEYFLNEGDSVFFDAKIPHICEAAKNEEVKCLCVIYNR